MFAAAPKNLSFYTCLLMLAACPSSGGETTASTGDATATAASTTTTNGTTATSEGTDTTAPTTDAPTTSTTTGGMVREPFSLQVLDNAWISGMDGWNTQHQDVAFDLGEGPFSKVTLIVDLDTDCYPWEKWQDSPPPQGQYWPASCDAFDRTMGFISDPAADADSPPGFELLRSITPFGGPAHLEADITDYANAHPGGHMLRSYINSWPDGAGQVSGSAGGWHLSVRVEGEPGPAPREVLAAVSLFSGDVGVDGATTTVPFNLPEGVKKAELVYTVSGHGGATDNIGDCIGPAEEFCKRKHNISFDGALVTSFDAWRTDCSELCTVTTNDLGVGPDKFCAENPCGAIASVNAARANWCPGALVAPLRGPVTSALGAGPDHEFQFAIDGVVEGGTWTVSAALYAYGQ
ncbi:peptide-N-glycosidase F-related protein [Nannocystis punicea]|uniref:Peptide-N-glycosidase F-related protein n=1 Tax=Nannocystis punicea TaxID=2995304 RepID=A0ABY7H4U7_9BACT|nr:peptide-N-glycosidase F-related protein [Nannocystis poenicansa]WAS94306.1 peptide-N-glycosidase F-related protein [Nannocystis poenicansa]